jgi:hypothetical protein
LSVLKRVAHDPVTESLYTNVIPVLGTGEQGTIDEESIP